MTSATVQKKNREKERDEGVREREKSTLNHSLSVLLVLWSVFSLRKRGEIRLSWNRGGREAV